MTDATPTPETPAGSPSNLRVRAQTAAILLPGLIAGILIGGVVWAALFIPVAVIGLLEFYALAHGDGFRRLALAGVPAAIAIVIGFYVDAPGIWLAGLVGGPLVAGAITLAASTSLAAGWRAEWVAAVGLIYVALPVGCIVAARTLEEGLIWTLVIAAGTIATDTFAYFGGRRWGRRKLAPRLSPKKTVEGAVVGAICGALVPLVILGIGDHLAMETAIMAAALPIVAILGDLLESAIKRCFDVKDSHLPNFNIIPGHGGVLDRVDALLMVGAFVYIYVRIVVIS